MEKLIFEYYETDGLSYGTTHYIPFEYESIQKATEDLIYKMCYHDKKIFGFNSREVAIRYNEYGDVHIYTLEEWFNINKTSDIL